MCGVVPWHANAWAMVQSFRADIYMVAYVTGSQFFLLWFVEMVHFLLKKKKITSDRFLI